MLNLDFGVKHARIVSQAATVAIYVAIDALFCTSLARGPLQKAAPPLCEMSPKYPELQVGLAIYSVRVNLAK